MSDDDISVAIVGLGFGEDFLPVYRAHPRVREIAIVDSSAERVAEVGDRYGVDARYTDFHTMLEDPRWDAVHILVPVSLHAEFAVAALEAGKHAACAVPMALETEDLRRVVEAERVSGKHYMMMETAVYGREYRWTRAQVESGRFGGLTAYRGFHHQNLDGYPEYWRGYPPMKYATHALTPLLALTGTTVDSVVAHGTGRLTPDREGAYDNPFPAETGLFSLRSCDVVAEIAMSFFQVGRPYVEGFDLFCEDGAVEWPAEHEGPLRVSDLQALEPHLPDRGLRGRRAVVADIDPPDIVGNLPDELVPYLREFSLPAADGGPRIVRRAEHSGSHPHLVHEFVSAVCEGREPAVSARTSAAWTAAGICAHESALLGGQRVEVPQF